MRVAGRAASLAKMAHHKRTAPRQANALLLMGNDIESARYGESDGFGWIVVFPISLYGLHVHSNAKDDLSSRWSAAMALKLCVPP